MSALAVLYIILPLPVLFLLHKLEEIATQHHWMLKRRESLLQRFPKMAQFINHWAKLSKKTILLTALEELLLVGVITLLVLSCNTDIVLYAWIALLGGWALHLLGLIAHSIAVRDYVPGLITAILSLPYVCYGFYSLLLAYAWWHVALCTLVGFIVLSLNSALMHKLGEKIN